MIKYWQSMHDYLHFLNESKVHFDSSERIRLHTEFWKPWHKLRSFDTDRTKEFLLPFYSSTGRPTRNQPLILRFTSAKRHDLVSFLVPFHELEKHMPAIPIDSGVYRLEQ